MQHLSKQFTSPKVILIFLLVAILLLSGCSKDGCNETCYLDLDGDGYAAVNTVPSFYDSVKDKWHYNVRPTRTMKCGRCESKSNGYYISARGNQFKGTGDLNDFDYYAYPGATEMCDGVDNNLNGIIDEQPGSAVIDVEQSGNITNPTISVTGTTFPLIDDIFAINRECEVRGYNGGYSGTLLQNFNPINGENLFYENLVKSDRRTEEYYGQTYHVITNLKCYDIERKSFTIGPMNNRITYTMDVAVFKEAFPNPVVTVTEDLALPFTGSIANEYCLSLDQGYNYAEFPEMGYLTAPTEEQRAFNEKYPEFKEVSRSLGFGEFNSLHLDITFQALLDSDSYDDTDVEDAEDLPGLFSSTPVGEKPWYENISMFFYPADSSNGGVGSTYSYPIVKTIECTNSPYQNGDFTQPEKNVCDIQDEFSYYCADEGFIVRKTILDEPRDKTPTSGRNVQTLWIPNIYYADSYISGSDLTYENLMQDPDFTETRGQLTSQERDISTHTDYDFGDPRKRWKPDGYTMLRNFPAIFDPDKRSIYCQGEENSLQQRTCGFDWVEGAENDLEWFGQYDVTNYCCGDDVYDVGTITFGDDSSVNICMQNPDGFYEWIQPGGKSDFQSASSSVVGNIYPITKSDGSTYDFTFADMENIDFCGATQSDIPDGMRTQFSTSFYSENEVTNIDFLGNVNEYICHKTIRNTLEFSECFADNGRLNYFDKSALQDKVVNGQTVPLSWTRSSISLRGSLVQLSTFESGPEDFTFSIPSDIDSYVVIQETSNNFYEGSRALSVRSDLSSVSTDLRIESEMNIDVSEYENISGYIYFDQVPYVDMYIDTLRYPLENYINEPVLAGKWLHFTVPIDSLDTIGTLAFEIDSSLANYNESMWYQYYIDDLHLIHPEQKSYCGQELTPGVSNSVEKTLWVEDRDDNRFACEGGKYAWTGNQCCGDDLNEYYVDENAACLSGQAFNFGTSITPVSFTVNGQPVEGYCSSTIGEDCEFPLPRLSFETDFSDTAEVKIDPYDKTLYDIKFKSNGQNVTTNMQDTIVVDIKKYILANLNQEELSLCGDDSLLFNSMQPYMYTDEIQEREEDGVCTVSSLFTCLQAKGWVMQSGLEDLGYERNDDGTYPDIETYVDLKEIPDRDTYESEITYATGCCPSNFCWNGDYCVEDQSDEPLMLSQIFFQNESRSGYRCVAGEWTESFERYGPQGQGPGFCPEEDQCYYSSIGTADNNGVISEMNGTPQCINSGEYFQDYYCDSGKYISRTKLLSENMIEHFGRSGFSIYCDVPDNTLHLLGKIQGKDVNSYVTGSNTCNYDALGFPAPCMNDFCVIESGGKIAFGTTLNQDLDSINYSAVDLFGITGCVSSGELTKCSNAQIAGRSTSWYYDSSLNAIINSEFGRSNFIVDLFNSIKEFFFGEDVILTLDYADAAEVFPQLQEFIHISTSDSLYYAKDGSNQIIAISGQLRELLAGKNYRFVAVRYTGLDGVCEYLKNSDAEVFCETQGEDTYVFILSQNILRDTWVDITTKLRLFED